MSFANHGKHVLYKDPAGNTIRFFEYKGIPFPIFPGDMVTRMEKLKDFTARPDDVIICGYAKSGTNWVWEIISMLLSGTAENVAGNKMTMMLECRDSEDLDDKPSPRVLNTHLLLPDLPPDIRRRNTRVVYLLRNPKDVCVSHYHHSVGMNGLYEYDGDWENYLKLWLNGHVDYGCWFTFVKHWEEQLKRNPELNVHVIHYENLKLNFKEETRKLADFLGVSHGEGFYQKMAEKCDIKTMREFKAQWYSDAEHAFWRNNESNFFRKGIIGDWKNHFTVSQNEQFDDVIKDRLRDSDLTFTYES